MTLSDDSLYTGAYCLAKYLAYSCGGGVKTWAMLALVLVSIVWQYMSAVKHKTPQAGTRAAGMWKHRKA